jgi:hypothetical protein
MNDSVCFSSYFIQSEKIFFFLNVDRINKKTDRRQQGTGIQKRHDILMTNSFFPFTFSLQL